MKRINLSYGVISMTGFDEMVTGAVEKVIPNVVNISEVKLMKDAYLHVHPVPGVGSGWKDIPG